MFLFVVSFCFLLSFTSCLEESNQQYLILKHFKSDEAFISLFHCLPDYMSILKLLIVCENRTTTHVDVRTPIF